VPPYCGCPEAGEVEDGFVAGAESVGADIKKAQDTMIPRKIKNFFIPYLLVIYFSIKHIVM
jgi:hypothetical protein